MGWQLSIRNKFSVFTQTKKVALILMTDELCKSFHCYVWGLDLKSKGHDVKIVLEGPATRHLAFMNPQNTSDLAQQFRAAHAAGLIVGACQAAAVGCACGGPCAQGEGEPLTQIAEQSRIPMLAEVHGHAGITDFVDQGYQIIVF